mmetsp:Transcript_43964/g.116196  ORF Transcript_43964/g.116196 Transcript_43964/m.116196 type:complete len:434 (+) Transcript_43964:93-1394(+)
MRPADARESSDSSRSSDEPWRSEQIRSNFLWFSLLFSINHGVVTTPLVISTSVLAGGVGYLGNALLNIFTVVSAFFLGAPMVGLLGLRGATLFGMLFYCVYVGLFAGAALVGKHQHDLQMASFGAGSVCGGIAAGVLWTAQGGYFSSTVDHVARLESSERTSLTASLSGTFAAFYLGAEVTSKLAWSALDYAKVPNVDIACAFALVGLIAMLLMTKALDLPAGGAPAKCTNRFQAAAALWKDPVLFLVSGLNLTFGFSAAFMNGFVNANFATPQLGSFAAPLLAAFTALLAAVLARVYGEVAVLIGKGPLVVVGAISFAGIGSCFFLLSCCEGWHWWLLVLYTFQGSGRAIYESTNKGIFADLFPNDSVGAFSNCMLQSSLAFALCFFLSDVLKGPVLAAIALSLALATPLGYFVAIQRRSTLERRPLAENAA